MSDASPLLVPMTVEALVVNDHVRAPRNQIETFLRSQMSYNAIQNLRNGQPFLSEIDTNFTLQGNMPSGTTTSAYYNGVYLKWRMPDAFTEGQQSSVDGRTTYRRVPNRWLVVRYSGALTGRQATAWVVESDYLYSTGSSLAPANYSQQPSIYVQPSSATVPTPVGVYMGQNFSVGSWAEPGTSLGLTAVAPGNPAFAFYQPYCNNVFSFVDCLDGQPDETLSYLVLGWFSDASDDPLAPGMASVATNAYNTYSGGFAVSATSPTEVQWTAGRITAQDGAAYDVVAGASGTLAAEMYLYIDPGISATKIQATATLATAQAPGCVPCATATPFFLAQLDALGWTLPPGTDPAATASWSMLCGSVGGVSWQSSALPAGGTPNGLQNPVSVAVGNTSVEALTALITAQAGTQVEPELLEAFQLNQLDAFDRPDGSAVLQEKLRASFFQRRTAGYSWTIVDAPDSTAPVPAAELAKEAAWLATLNGDQQALDGARLLLESLQRQLYLMWWKYESWPQAYQGSSAIPCLADEDGGVPSSLTDQLDPNRAGSLAQRVKLQKDAVDALVQDVPHGDTQDELSRSILAYEAKQDLPATRLLKRSIAGTFQLPNNPVVLISGAGASGIVQSPDLVQCRFDTQIVGGFTCGTQTVTAQTPALSIPQPQLSGVTGVPWQQSLVASLVDEFFLTDAANAAAIAAAIGADDATVAQAMGQVSNYATSSQGAAEVYPDGAVATWTANPWHPLLLFWQARYYPIAYGTPSTPNWTFEGTHYTWNQSQAAVVSPYMGLTGLSQLTPNASFNMASRIAQFLNNNPDLDPAEAAALQQLLAFVQSEDAWDLLSQQLDGFNEQLMLGTPGVFLSPDASSLVRKPTLQSLIGDAGAYPPIMPPIPMQGKLVPPSQFQPWRAGQFEFVSLVLVDEWGQALWPINTSDFTNENVFLPADLSPVLTSNPVSLAVTADPAISSVQPNVLPAGSDATLTVDGVNFAAGAQVQWNGSALATTFVSATQLTATLRANQAAAGQATVTVVSGTTSGGVTVEVASGPGIGALSPAVFQAGTVTSDALEVTVTGIGFSAGALVAWNGTPVDTEVVSADTVIAAVPANYLFAPGTATVTVASGAAASNGVPFTIMGGAAIAALDPDIVATGSGALTLTANGVGFEPNSVLNWNGSALTTTFVSSQQITAAVGADLLTASATVTVTESVGAKVVLNAPDPFIQLPPALLQPARLNFDLVSATGNGVAFGSANPASDPIAGWVLPNHLDRSLMAYDAGGALLGELSVGVATTGDPAVFWTAAPDSPHSSLDQIPHFGAFLIALSRQTPATVLAFLQSIDETLWTTAPMGAAFDQSLAVLIGRPLAFVRARLQFQLQGTPYLDPSWQYTFDPNDCSKLAEQDPVITSYRFGIELGNVGKLEDGLIGYFVGDDYGTFNVVTQSGASEGGYLKLIGDDDNYLYLSFDAADYALVSMLVDPRASVHATTAILPDVSVSLPPTFTSDALAAMKVTFRIDGLFSDQQPDPAGVAPPTILTAVPKVSRGTWKWLENDSSGWVTYPTGLNDTTARLSAVPPVLRRGLLQLTLDSDASEPSAADQT